MKIVRIKHQEIEQFGTILGHEIQIYHGVPWGNFIESNIFLNVDEVEFLPPILPTKIICIALNYSNSPNNEAFEPVVFLKPPSSLIGNNGKIESPFILLDVWGESELGIVINKQAKNITEKESISYILGYTIANDVTANNIDNRDHHLARSKCADSFCAVGPWIDTDFNPGNNCIQGFQNNILIRESNLNKRIWGDAKIISWLSSWMTLEPGDLILTGAPPRVTNKIFLKNNDVYSCKIENLGILENTFIEKY